jgi:hypothetical protein
VVAAGGHRSAQERASTFAYTDPNGSSGSQIQATVTDAEQHTTTP